MDDEKNVEELKAQQDGLLKQLNETGYDWNAHPSVAGIIKDNQSERKNRQDADAEVERLRGENTTLAEELAAKVAKPEGKDDLSDSDYLTVGQAKKLLSGVSEEKEKATKNQQTKDLQVKFFKSEKKAKAEYTTEKYGEGLDYSSVLKGYARVIQNEPAYQEVMIAAEDPAKKAYEIGLLDTEISKKVEASKNVKLLDKMKTDGTIPKGGGGGLSIDDKTYEELLNMPMSDLMKSLKEEEAAK